MNGQRLVLDAIAIDWIKGRNEPTISIAKKMTDSKMRNVKQDVFIRQHFRDSPSRHRIIKNPGNGRG